ncbi:MAG: cell division FtsK/SpoIIIE [Candidatus Gottesmanbacteria bacterium GW2011_GWA1_47_8]|uniref:Cell division FtsK/SpoIIIE n=1 Tax=Candidatus Gottesmanbacteria bacterium GW2011_GWA1_47_8 TaxID=1618438 RepID=A0A0G1WEH0_9BACT|nr:MAG: cell division FtsK/SpoIIIE [Candidatus Gottesmanbacteria bacterium GW2011_GWA1_47_8]
MISFSRQGPILEMINALGSKFFGWALLLIPFLFVSGGLLLTKVKWQIARPNVFLGMLLTIVSLTGLTRSGSIGLEVFISISSLITPWGGVLLFFAGVVIGQLVFWETSLEDIAVFFQNLFGATRKMSQTLPSVPAFSSKILNREVKIKGMVGNLESAGQETKPVEAAAEPSKATTKDEVISSEASGVTIWRLPSLNLLSDIKSKLDPGDTNKNKTTIEKTLASFGIEAWVREINLGPAVTQYAIELREGTKVSKILNLQNDLALALSAPQGMIRIEAPIPGRNYVGIEVPNRSLAMVSLKNMLASDAMKKNPSKTLVALGLNVAGEPTVVDIAKMPHVLIAGATGSGKSVSINAFIVSILFRASPSEVKFILVDPKRVELNNYNGIPHLLTPVITEPDKVVSALKWAVGEMNRRYKLLSEVGARNIVKYNEISGFQAMPYIIIIIDELADIMLAAPGEVEEAVTRIAQMARAVGLHLVLATQRPSVNVITGLIKANIPCRIAFNVTSMVDSRVIIDTPGAEKLLGRGDMLFIPPDDAKPRRIQGTNVEDAEIEALVNYLRNAGVTPEYSEEVTMANLPKPTLGANGEDMGQVDRMFEEAVRICAEYGKASASLLQRRLSIGYARAARILDQLERAGVVSAPEGSKPREVLIRNADEFLAKRNETSEQ